jgi:predicted Co/Zn/Cd cation transporter (cation efflux family)
MVDRITAAARRRGLSVDTYSRSDSETVVELPEPGAHGYRYLTGKLTVKRDRSGLIAVHNRSRLTASAISAVLVSIAAAFLLVALCFALEARSIDVSDMSDDVARGMTAGVAFIFAVLGVLVLFPLAWIWRPLRRRWFNALDSLIDETKKG